MDRNIITVSLLIVYFSLHLPCATACNGKATVKKEKKIQQVPQKYCETEACYQIAEELRRHMNFSVHPCDSFYEFTCGNFTQDNSQSGDLKISRIDEIHNQINERLKELLEAESPADEQRHFKLTKQLYKLCENREKQYEQSLTPILDVLKRLGGWPVVEEDKWNETNFDWLEMEYKLQDAGISAAPLIKLDIGVDIKNNSQRLLTLKLPSFNHYWDYKSVQSHWKHIVDVAVIFGADRQRAMLELQEAVDFERALVHPFKLPEEEEAYEEKPNGIFVNTSMTIANLTQKYPGIPWKKYFQKMLPENITVNENEIIDVDSKSYIYTLEKLLNETSKRVLANYMMYRTALDLIPIVYHDNANQYYEYDREKKAFSDHSVPWKWCVSQVYKLVPLSVSAMYIRKYASEKTNIDIIDIVENIRKQLSILIRRAYWMDDQTRKHALNKVDSIVSYVGYENLLLSDYNMEKIYKDLVINETDWLTANMNVTHWLHVSKLKELRNPVKKSDFSRYDTAIDVNAYYYQYQNSIQITTGILHLYRSDLPKYVTYATVGFIIGHEMAHSFDSYSRHFDKVGNLARWLSAKSEKEYRRRIYCIVEQYRHLHSSYSRNHGFLMDSSYQTKDENIADILGLKLAYLAYEDWVKRNGRELSLPNLPYKPNQLFWISYSNGWCSAESTDYIMYQMMKDTHSPNEIRITGSIINSYEFPGDFFCYRSHIMNSWTKCGIL